MGWLWGVGPLDSHEFTTIHIQENTKIPVSSDLDHRNQPSKLLKCMIYPLECIIIFAPKPSSSSGLDSGGWNPINPMLPPSNWRDLAANGFPEASPTILVPPGKRPFVARWRFRVVASHWPPRCPGFVGRLFKGHLFWPCFFFALPLALQMTSSLSAS